MISYVNSRDSDMKIRVPDIPEEGLLQEADLPVVINDHTGPGIAHVLIKIFRFGKRLLVEGAVRTSVTVKCSRCLKDSLLPLDLTFREEYLPAEEPGGGKEQELTNKDLDLGFYTDDELDVTELVKEQVLLAVPMKPLCRDDCPGLCPFCGKDLNEGPCGCRKEEIDPRLAPLEKFKELLKD
ncbi:MAG: DUF177 domain-containing protein [Nitrospiraceae bacterium]|nr:MAG: DUF177 domain-containing protein [Nitrospiraceae bacterium]